MRVQDAESIPVAVEKYLDQIAARVACGDEPPGRDGLVRVFVLGRYRFERALMPDKTWPGVDLISKTAPGSKGMEAYYVVIPDLSQAGTGSPATSRTTRCSTSQWPRRTRIRTRRSEDCLTSLSPGHVAAAAIAIAG